MKKILIINGHPNKESFNTALLESYHKGARESGASIDVLTIADLDFNPNLQQGYSKRTTLEPDLLKAWEQIQKADHLVWVHPVWWGGLPALTKGFVDRLFLPGLVFRYRENSVWWDKLLTGKTAHIITTLDQPGWYYRLMYGRPSVNQLRKSILEYCGVAPVKLTYIGPVRNSTEKTREKFLQKVYKQGLQQR